LRKKVVWRIAPNVSFSLVKPTLRLAKQQSVGSLGLATTILICLHIAPANRPSEELVQRQAGQIQEEGQQERAEKRGIDSPVVFLSIAVHDKASIKKGSN